jgi:hypothetical protein
LTAEAKIVKSFMAIEKDNLRIAMRWDFLHHPLALFSAVTASTLWFLSLRPRFDATRVIYLVDNGSLRADSFLSLRVLAARVSSLSGESVQAASARFADRVPGLSPPGETVETVLARDFLRAAPPGAVVVLPAFFGPSDTLTQLVPSIVARAAASAGVRAPRLITAAPIVNIADTGDARIAGALRDGVLATLAGAGGALLRDAAVVLCDHGSPLPAVGAVRAHLAAQLRSLLPEPPRAFSAASMERRDGDAFDFNNPLLEVLLRTPPFDDGLVVVALAFLSPGKHAGPGGDLVGIAASAERDAEAAGRALRVLFTPLLAPSSAVAEVLRDRLVAALP